MDTLQKVISNGTLSFFLQDNNDPDIEAWAAYNLLRPPKTLIEKHPKFFFGIPEIDKIFGGIQGLWEIHGKKNTGKTFLCKKLASNCKARVLYCSQSAALCQEFVEMERNTQDHSRVVGEVHFSLKSLLRRLLRLVNACEYELIILEGMSGLLFIEEEGDIVKEVESVLKRLSRNLTIIVTCNVNNDGNIIGHYLWNDAITNNIYVTKPLPTTISLTHYKYNITSVEFPI